MGGSSATRPPAPRVANLVDMDRLGDLGTYLKARVRGQDDVLDVVAKAVQRAESGFAPVGRPMASFLFLGPTGVGKTESALSLSEFLYGDEDHLKRFDMAEYQSREAIIQLLGDPRTGTSGLMGLALKDEALGADGGILLFDEIEKADSGLSTVFLSALDAGHITTADGTTHRLDHLYLIFTSNLGSADAIRMQRLPQETISRRVLEAATKFFRPELLARFQEKLVFNRLSYEVQREIALGLLNKQQAYVLAVHGAMLRWDEEVVTYLMDRGFTKQLGARPMRAAIEREVGDVLTRLLMSGEMLAGALLQLGIVDGKIVVRKA